MDNNSQIKKQDHNVSEILLKINNSEIKEEYEKVLKKIIDDFSAPGFRKGKAPRDLVEKSLDKSKTASTIIQNLLQTKYSEILTKHNLMPIVDPKISIEEPKNLEEILQNSDLTIKIFVAEAPEIKLNNYQEKIKGELAKSEIWTPEKGEKQEEKAESKEEKEQKRFMKIIDIVMENCSVDLSDMIIENETNRILIQTLDEVKKLGLSLDEYLKNTGRTIDTLKSEATKKATENLKIGFIFDEIAKTEKITVNQADLDKIFAEIKDPKQKNEAEKNAYRIAPIILRQKVVDFLLKI